MPKQAGKGEFEVDFGVGKLTFSGLFRGIGDLVDLASKLGEESEVKKSGEIKGLPREAKGVYGFSIRTVVGGKPLVETFGNIRNSARGPVVEEVREPMADVFDEKDHILVVVELPGVEQKDVKIELEGDVLKLTASSKTHKYAREVLLPSRVNPEAMKTTYKNGVLEIRLPKPNSA